MIRNINLIDAGIDLNSYYNEYSYQALANLGQRFSIKGDGLAFGHFTLKDLFPKQGVTNYTKDYEIILNAGYIGIIYDGTSLTPVYEADKNDNGNYDVTNENNAIKYQILFHIFYDILTSNHSLDPSDEEHQLHIVVNPNYQFTYAYKDYNSQLIVFNTDSVNVIASKDTGFDEETESSVDYVYLFFNDREKTINYNYNIEYLNDDTEYKFNLNKYTDPYVYEDYWYINNQATDVRATGKDAGTSNVVFCKSEGDTFTMLSTYSQSPLITVQDKLLHDVTVTPLQLVGNNNTVQQFNSNNIKYSVYLPDPSSCDEITRENIAYTTLVDIYTYNYNNCAFNISTLWNYDLNGIAYQINSLDGVNTLSLHELTSFDTLCFYDTINKVQDPPYHWASPELICYSSQQYKNNISVGTTFFDIKQTSNCSAKVSFNRSINYTDVTGSLVGTSNQKAPNIYTTLQPVEGDAFIQQFSTTAADDTIPNNAPHIDLKSVFVKNPEIANKVNITSFSKTESKVYYSYFGTEITEPQTLILGTSNKNGSFGANVMNGDLQNTFTKVNNLKVEIDNVYVNGTSYINKPQYINDRTWTKIGDGFYKTSYTAPTDKVKNDAAHDINYINIADLPFLYNVTAVTSLNNYIADGKLYLNNRHNNNQPFYRNDIRIIQKSNGDMYVDEQGEINTIHGTPTF